MLRAAQTPHMPVDHDGDLRAESLTFFHTEMSQTKLSQCCTKNRKSSQRREHVNRHNEHKPLKSKETLQQSSAAWVRQRNSHLCDVRMSVVPADRSLDSVSHSVRRATGSIPLVGSSRNTTGGAPTSAIAVDSLRLLPPLAERANQWTSEMYETTKPKFHCSTVESVLTISCHRMGTTTNIVH